MFLVSWSLFSRLSLMKNSVSSSWGKRRGGHHKKPEAKADHRVQPRGLAPNPFSSQRGLPPSPVSSLSRSPGPDLGPFLHLHSGPIRTCFSLSSISRRRADASCGGIIASAQQLSLPGAWPLRALSAPVCATPTSALCPSPGGAGGGSTGGAMLGVAAGTELAQN